MKFHWERAPRLPRPPAWAAAVVGAWALLVLAGVLLERWGAPAQETCLLHRLTGHSCPTCGSTRVVLGFIQGQWRQALWMNPFVAIGLVAGGLWLGLRLALGRTLRADLSPGERGVALALGLALLLANWIWVLRTQP